MHVPKHDPPVHIPKAPPPPHVNKYRKKDTTKPNYYLIDTLIDPVPIKRALFHDNIDKEQGKADSYDGRTDNLVRITTDSLITDSLTKALLRDVDRFQVMIENFPPAGRDEFQQNQHKIQCLRAVWEMMRLYTADPKPDPIFYIQLVANMKGMLIASNENKLMDYVVAHTTVLTLDNSKVLLDNHPAERAYIYTQIGKASPIMMIKRLPEFGTDTFAANIIKAAARISPGLVFNYATSTNRLLRDPIFATQDSLVQAIVAIASRSKSPTKAFPFFTDIYRGRKTIEEVDTIVEHPDLYFQALVQLKLENDTIAKKAYTAEIEYRALKDFVRQMNERHEQRDEERFRCIDSLPATSMYYIMVYGQDEIYTSSFLGTFKRMMERMKPLRGNQLLDTLHYDHFRTFIRMCAGYNTLSTFLASMDDTSRSSLMSGFIGGLQNGKEDDLEDAVDVADALGSIRDSALSVFLQKKIKDNYELAYKEKNKKGIIIYSLLSVLADGARLSGNDTAAQAASEQLHLPPINKVPFKTLVNDSGIVYQQVFFYGDEDGKASYDGFIEEFKKNSKWKITTDKYWSAITSVSGQKVVIYANLPLKDPEDQVAQDSLNKFLADSGIHPTIIIHRGHSYHLPTTLARLNTAVKIVILGSCGGYHNLALVLNRAPDAHIVSSKQTGVGAINEPILRGMNAMLLDGADVNWMTMWRDLDEYFAKKKELLEKYSDYVPPYKNLGAIFIKAYRQMLTK